MLFFNKLGVIFSLKNQKLRLSFKILFFLRIKKAPFFIKITNSQPFIQNS